VFPHGVGQFTAGGRFQQVRPDPVREGEPAQAKVFLDRRDDSLGAVVELLVVRVDHLVEVPGEPEVPRLGQERVQPPHTVREPRDQWVLVVQVLPGGVEGPVQPVPQQPPGGGTPVHDVAVVPVVPDEEPRAVVGDRLHDLVGGAEVVPGHEVGVAKAVGIFLHLVRRHEPLFEQPDPGLLLALRPIRVELPGKRPLDHRERERRWNCDRGRCPCGAV
jgi:hypothetical protein